MTTAHPPRPRIGLALGVLLLVAPPALADDIKYPGYLPTFPVPSPAQGVGPRGSAGTYLGGDAGFACPLDETREYWSFADVGIGVAGARQRTPGEGHGWSVGVGNTIAISSCRNGYFFVKHYFRGTAERPHAFFLDPNNPEETPKGSRLWLRKPTLYKGKLYIFAHQIVDPGGVFNTLLIRVANPLDDPDRWNYDYLNVGIFPRPPVGADPRKAAPVNFGTEVIVDEANNMLYTYGLFADKESGFKFLTSFYLYPARLPLDKLESTPANGDLGPSMQHMAKDGSWKDGLFDPNDVKRVDIPAFNSYAVRYNQTLKAYQAVYAHDRDLGEYHAGHRKFDDPKVNSVWMKIGPTPYGPWGEPRVVATYPEMDPKHDRIVDRPHGRECYGYFMNEHPEFETWDGDIVFCYTIGSYTEVHDRDSRVKQNNMKLYNVYAWPAPNPFFAPMPGEVPKP